jgi:hypothetical protein
MAGKGKARIYKLSAKQTKKASGLFKGGKGVTTKTGLAAGLRKAKMPASGQAIINFLKSKRGAQVAQPFHKQVYTYMAKHKVGRKDAMKVVMQKPEWKKPREARERVKGLRGRMKTQRERREQGGIRAQKTWSLYYEVGVFPGSPPFECKELDGKDPSGKEYPGLTEQGGHWEGQTRHIEWGSKPSTAFVRLQEGKVKEKYEGHGMPTRNFRLVRLVVTEKQAKVNKQRRKEAEKASHKKSMRKGR